MLTFHLWLVEPRKHQTRSDNEQIARSLPGQFLKNIICKLVATNCCIWKSHVLCACVRAFPGEEQGVAWQDWMNFHSLCASSLQTLVFGMIFPSVVNYLKASLTNLSFCTPDGHRNWTQVNLHLYIESSTWISCVCVCVCVWERERERDG